MPQQAQPNAQTESAVGSRLRLAELELEDETLPARAGKSRPRQPQHPLRQAPPWLRRRIHPRPRLRIDFDQRRRHHRHFSHAEAGQQRMSENQIFAGSQRLVELDVFDAPVEKQRRTPASADEQFVARPHRALTLDASGASKQVIGRPAKDQRRRSRLGKLELPLQFVGHVGVVVVQIGDVTSAGGTQAAIAGPPRPAGFGIFREPHPRVGQPARHFGAGSDSVGRVVVVDENEFPPGYRLLQDAGHGARQEVGTPAGRQNDCHEWLDAGMVAGHPGPTSVDVADAFFFESPSALMARSRTLLNSPRKILLVVVSVAVAIYAGLGIAQGEFGFAMLAACVGLLAIVDRVSRVPLDANLIGFVLIGYIVGNRGFAQQTLMTGLPLLPAEAVLAIVGAWLVIKSGIERKMPIQRSALHLLLLLWFTIGIARLMVDLPRYRFLALRDFATVYYASFFFIVQAHATEARTRSFLRRCFLIGVLLVPVVFVLFTQFPGFFVRYLTLRGVPLIFVKGDVAIPIAAAGIFLLHFDPLARGRWWAPGAALALLLFVFASNSRAAQAGVIVVDCWLLFRRSRLPWLHLGTLGLTALLLAALAFSGQADWAEKKLTSSVERVLSVVDVSGTMTYRSEDLGDKADNNRFRLVWWRAVARETIESNPALGLGFGYDLARGFVTEYDWAMGEDFSARSPHNVALTVFGRMGFAGILVCLGIVWVMARSTNRSLTANDGEATGLWCMVWVILVSACFGIVLEGPMGALPFWVLVGLAYQPDGTSGSEPVPTRAASERPIAPLRAEGAGV